MPRRFNIERYALMRWISLLFGKGEYLSTLSPSSFLLSIPNLRGELEKIEMILVIKAQCRSRMARLVKVIKEILHRSARVVLAYFNLPMPSPKIIMIECTNKCNAQCIICPREKMTRKQGFMSFELFKKIIDEAAYLKIRKVQLSNFGEPLLDPYLSKKIKYAQEQGLEIYLVTNGSLIDQAMARNLILSGLDKIRISVYGATKSTYESIHKRLQLNVVEGNIRNLISLKKGMASDKPYVELQFMLCKETASELQEFYRKWKGVADKITIAGLHNFGDGRSYIPMDRYKRINTCYFPFTVMEVLWNGDVVPCAYDFNGCLKMGNVDENNIDNIWNNERYRELRRLQLTRRFSADLLCQRCHRNRVVSLGAKCLETSVFDLKTGNADE